MPGRPLPRRSPIQERRIWENQYRNPQGAQWRDAGHTRAHSRDAAGVETSRRGDEVMATATFRIWRGDRQGGRFQDYTTEVSEGMVVLDAMHKIQAEQAN